MEDPTQIPRRDSGKPEALGKHLGVEEAATAEKLADTKEAAEQLVALSKAAVENPSEPARKSMP